MLDMPLLQGAQKEQAEVLILTQLQKLLRLCNTTSELKSLTYYVMEAMENFDVRYIIAELNNIVRE